MSLRIGTGLGQSAPDLVAASQPPSGGRFQPPAEESLPEAPSGPDWSRYRTDPAAFFHDILGWQPWSKQLDIAFAVRDALVSFPPLPSSEAAGKGPASSPGVRSRRIAVRSANGVGKTAAAARIMLWVARCWPDSMVVTTAPTTRQVDELLWRQARSAYHHAKVPLGGKFYDGQSRWDLGPNWFAIGVSPESNAVEKFQGFHAETLVFIVDEASGVPETHWEAIKGNALSGRSTVLAIGNPTRLHGEFYDAFHTRQDLWRRLAISAFDTPNLRLTTEHTESTEQKGSSVPSVVNFPIPGLVTREAVEEARADWGEDSPLWQIRILGQFAAEAENSLFSLQWLEGMEAVDWIDGPWSLGVDVARAGTDQTALVLMKGNAVVHMEAWRGQDTMRTAGRVKELWDRLRWVYQPQIKERTEEEERRYQLRIERARERHEEYWEERRREEQMKWGSWIKIKVPQFVWKDPDLEPKEHRLAIAIDDGGVGGGVVDRLKEMGVWLHAVTFGAAPRRDKFKNRLSEMYWDLREQLREGKLRLGEAPNPPAPFPAASLEGRGSFSVKPALKSRLFAQLMQIDFEQESDRVIRVHKRGLDGHGRSPDLADALALAVEARRRGA